MTNGEAVDRIVSHVAALAKEQGVRDLTVTTETDGTKTFRHKAVSVHLFESNRELHFRGPDSAPATRIVADAEGAERFSPALIGTGAQNIIALLQIRPFER